MLSRSSRGSAVGFPASIGTHATVDAKSRCARPAAGSRPAAAGEHDRRGRADDGHRRARPGGDRKLRRQADCPGAAHPRRRGWAGDAPLALDRARAERLACRDVRERRAAPQPLDHRGHRQGRGPGHRLLGPGPSPARHCQLARRGARPASRPGRADRVRDLARSDVRQHVPAGAGGAVRARHRLQPDHQDRGRGPSRGGWPLGGRARRAAAP